MVHDMTGPAMGMSGLLPEGLLGGLRAGYFAIFIPGTGSAVIFFVFLSRGGLIYRGLDFLSLRDFIGFVGRLRGLVRLIAGGFVTFIVVGAPAAGFTREKDRR